MLGLELFTHAFKMLFHDLWATARLSLLPYLLLMLVGVGGLILYLVTVGEPADLANPKNWDAGLVVAGLSLLVFVVIFFSWMAVAWHRYVLLEERPQTLLPNLNGQYVKAYFWVACKYTLLVVACLAPVAFLVSWLLLASGFNLDTTKLILGLIMIVGYALMFRLALILPAAALGKPISLKESWRATNGYFGALIVVAIASNLLRNLVGLFDGIGIFSLLLIVIVNWLSLAVGISVLTTLYGYCLENRELD